MLLPYGGGYLQASRHTANHNEINIIHAHNNLRNHQLTTRQNDTRANVMSQEIHQAEPMSIDSRPNKDAVPKANAAGKTPIQILHEYGAKHDKVPVYMLEKAEGQAHQPSFAFSVTVGDVYCTGKGPSKKTAKHMAAEHALRILEIDMTALNLQVKSESNGVGAELCGHPNSVGTLQELALQRGWRLPEYTLLSETGPTHDRKFTISCAIESLSETATACSKKAAKKAAAEKMVAKLQSLSGSSLITWTPKPRVRFDNLKGSSAEKISSLRRNPLSIPYTDYVELMTELSKEQNFDVSYLDIDELTANGQYQCLVELSTSPVTIYHGTGISRINAHNAAAHSALQYIKIMASTN
ncbi:interferon-inducible double-stranded RNA-dependent protein kinase activator A homolog [Syngnathus typhle]|uniref:interferon-inducible double-stranded RNA-dependent protein kinase activator A homolog n=1 Tax=Syngnathus typhle TaxID=161592 RepID=UPI002A6B6DFB|nr:interferon-inducible double-stranded RNA-dependent protein kinase activator A homolog [Syngnathus typhle]